MNLIGVAAAPRPMRTRYVITLAIGVFVVFATLGCSLAYYFLNEDSEESEEQEPAKTQHAPSLIKPSFKPIKPPVDEKPVKTDPEPPGPPKDEKKIKNPDEIPIIKPPEKPIDSAVEKKLEPIEVKINISKPPPPPKKVIQDAGIKQHDFKWAKKIGTFALGTVYSNLPYLKKWGITLSSMLKNYAIQQAKWAVEYVYRELTRPMPKQIQNAPPEVKPVPIYAKKSEETESTESTSYFWFFGGQKKPKKESAAMPDFDIEDEIVQLDGDDTAENRRLAAGGGGKSETAHGPAKSGIFDFFGNWNTPAKVRIERDDLAGMRTLLVNVKSWAGIDPASKDAASILRVLHGINGNELLAAYEASVLLETAGSPSFAAQVIESQHITILTKRHLLACLPVEVLQTLPGNADVIIDSSRLPLADAILAFATSSNPSVKAPIKRESHDRDKSPIPDIGARNGGGRAVDLNAMKAFILDTKTWVGTGLMAGDKSIWSILKDHSDAHIIIAHDLAFQFFNCTDRDTRTACLTEFVESVCISAINSELKKALFTSLKIDDLRFIDDQAKPVSSSRKTAAENVWKRNCRA